MNIKRVPPRAVANFDVVVMGTSLGGIDALATVLAGLPADFPAPILVTQHLYPHTPTLLPGLLAPHTRLRVWLARAGDSTMPGTVLLAPPDRHLLVAGPGMVDLSAGPKVNFARPAVDALFTSAAAHYGPRTLGVVLTGRLFDGAAGARAIHAAGGRILAQDRASAREPAMPRAATETGAVDFVLALDKIAAALVSLVMVEGVASVFGGRHPASALPYAVPG